MNSRIDTLLERNRAFAESEVWKRTPRLPFLPHAGIYVVTCLDPRTDPAEFLGLRFAEAIVERTVGGRVTDDVMRDLSYIGYLIENKAPEGPYFEVAVIHHTDCGSGLLADDTVRHGFAERSGVPAEELAQLPVLDPAATARADVGKILTNPGTSPKITVSGHVYDVETGLISTVANSASPQPGRSNKGSGGRSMS